MGHGRGCHLEFDAPLGEATTQRLELDLDDEGQILLRERAEADDLVDPIDELRLEEADRIAGQVARHDQHRVGEIDRAALTVGEPTVVEHLQQDVEHVRVSLLDLVEQHHRIGAAANRFGELTALVVADVSGRRTDEARHRVLLHVLAHVDTNHGLLVVEQILGERPGEFGLADTGRPQEHERTDRTVGVGQAGAAAADGVGHRVHRVLLTDHPLV